MLELERVGLLGGIDEGRSFMPVQGYLLVFLLTLEKHANAEFGGFVRERPGLVVPRRTFTDPKGPGSGAPSEAVGVITAT